MYKQLTQSAFTQHAPYLTESEKGNECDQHHQSPGEKFVPPCAHHFLQRVQQLFPDEKAADDVFENFKRQRKKAEQDYLVQGRDDQRPIIKRPDKSQTLTQQDYLCQHEGLNQCKPVMKITNEI